MKCKLAPALITASVVTLAGAFGARLVPDTQHYADGNLIPSPVGGMIGRVGGVPLLIAVSAISAGLIVGMLPTAKGRAIFLVFGGFWLLFPGVDAAGVLAMALVPRAPKARLLYFPIVLFTHAIAAIAAFGVFIGRKRIELAILLPLLVAVAFTIHGIVLGDPVGPIEHAIYLTRYLLPAIWMIALRS